MNEIPDVEICEEFLVCVNDKGKFLHEEGDGHATWNNWIDSPLLAKRFSHYIVYGQVEGKKEDLIDPLREASYYQRWPKLPDGCKMMWCRVRGSAWLRG
jgi:hypothetical protein